MKNHIWLFGFLITALASVQAENINEKLKDERIKAFCIDYNWGPPGPFARPGLWADADPVEHVKWYKELGANTIQTFAVSCNGYAWYKSDVVPEQPGLEHDFLTDMVRLGHAEGMRVMGYFCIAANTRWGKENPDQTIGLVKQHIPLTDEYLDFLSRSIKDALEKTNMDGFMVDWVWGPRTLPWNPAAKTPWLACEKKLFQQVMGKPFPGEEKLTQEDRLEYERKTIARCWDVIYTTAKSVDPDCIIWLSCAYPHIPEVNGSKMFEQVDWLMNENAETEYIERARHTAGPNTKIMQCLSGWGDKHNAQDFLDNPGNDDMGLYGFALADPKTGFPLSLAEIKQRVEGGGTEEQYRVPMGNARNIEALRKTYKGTDEAAILSKDDAIKAFCLDVNWKVGSDTNRINYFAPPGAWARLDPAEHVQWCKDLGVNAIQTFAVSCNGYAWYKGGNIPEQPGLQHDFLTEVVKLGRAEGMKVFGYYCVGSNTRWGLENPELSYGTPSNPHIPFTKEYISFLCGSIEEALRITDMDGFMIDWFWNPTVDLSGKWGDRSPKWLPCEQQMYLELMGKPFPGKEKITKADELAFNRRAIDRCWKAIHKTAKSAKPECIIWLSCSMLTHPEMKDSDLLKEIDWLQNEAGDKASIDAVRSQIGDHTQLITTFSGTFFKRNNLTGEAVAEYALKENIGIYCYASTGDYDKAFPPVKSYLEMPLDSITNLDVRNVAILARVFNGLPLDE